MKISLLLLTVAAACVLGVSSRIYLGPEARSSAGDHGGKPVEAPQDQIAANGVVEGARPEASLRLEVAGTIAAIKAREGQAVRRGELLVELANDTQKQQVSLARAELTIAQAELERLRNGERKEKRQASAAVEKARLVLAKQAENDWQRSKELRAGSDQTISREEFDNNHFKMLRAKADLEQAKAEHALVEAPARKEDIAAAEGRVAAAEAKLHLAETDLAKTRLLAPNDGRILQVHAEPGELATPTSTQPLLVMANLSHLRVRAFIEELDAGRVQVGQSAVITADGYPGKEYHGRVAVVIPRMGKRAPQTDQPNEYKDMYFREALIDLDSSADLPINLRVQVRIDTAAHASKR